MPAPEPTTTSQDSPLLGLPAEIRNMIYHLAIGSPTILAEAPTDDTSDWNISDLYGHEVEIKVCSGERLQSEQP